MNQFIEAIKKFDLPKVNVLLEKNPAWPEWSENGGKNALHYLCGVPTGGDADKEKASLAILQLLLKMGMDINAIHRIPEKDCPFPATPLWYAYTRGRNTTVYKWLLKQGADPEHCMFAIGWYDDVEAAALFHKHGANIEAVAGVSAFMAAYLWKKFNVAGWFLRNGAAVDYMDQKGRTALYHAVKRKYETPQIALLLKFGADVNKAADDGVTPLQMAARYRDKTISDLLSKAG